MESAHFPGRSADTRFSQHQQTKSKLEAMLLMLQLRKMNRYSAAPAVQVCRPMHSAAK